MANAQEMLTIIIITIIIIVEITSIFILYYLILHNHTFETFFLLQSLQVTAASIILGAIGLFHTQIRAQC